MNLTRLFDFKMLFVGMIVLGTSCGHSVPDARTQAKYQQTCDPVIQWLQTEFQSRGKYPVQLPQQQMRVLEQLGPPTEYRVLDNGRAFRISVGNYDVLRCPFVYSFMSAQTNWFLDR